MYIQDEIDEGFQSFLKLVGADQYNTGKLWEDHPLVDLSTSDEWAIDEFLRGQK